jgi:hypothetical protein
VLSPNVMDFGRPMYSDWQTLVNSDEPKVLAVVPLPTPQERRRRESMSSQTAFAKVRRVQQKKVKAVTLVML